MSPLSPFATSKSIQPTGSQPGLLPAPLPPASLHPATRNRFLLHSVPCLKLSCASSHPDVSVSGRRGRGGGIPAPSPGSLHQPCPFPLLSGRGPGSTQLPAALQTSEVLLLPPGLCTCCLIQAQGSSASFPSLHPLTHHALGGEPSLPLGCHDPLPFPHDPSPMTVSFQATFPVSSAESGRIAICGVKAFTAHPRCAVLGAGNTEERSRMPGL